MSSRTVTVGAGGFLIFLDVPSLLLQTKSAEPVTRADGPFPSKGYTQ